CHTRCRFRSRGLSDDCALTRLRQAALGVALVARQVQAAEQTIDMHTLAYLAQAQPYMDGQCWRVGTTDQRPAVCEAQRPVVRPYGRHHDRGKAAGAGAPGHLAGQLGDAPFRQPGRAAGEMTLVIVTLADPSHPGSMPLTVEIGEACDTFQLQQV